MKRNQKSKRSRKSSANSPPNFVQSTDLTPDLEAEAAIPDSNADQDIDAVSVTPQVTTTTTSTTTSVLSLDSDESPVDQTDDSPENVCYVCSVLLNSILSSKGFGKSRVESVKCCQHLNRCNNWFNGRNDTNNTSNRDESKRSAEDAEEKEEPMH